MSRQSRSPFLVLKEDVEDLFERSKRLRGDGDHDGAIGVLQEALGLIEESGWTSAPPGSREHNAVLKWQAECHGMIGGRLRDLDRIAQSRASYERGRKVEQESGAPSSYNTINMIATPIEEGSKSIDDLRSEIDAAVRMLELQTAHVREPDRWAWADLGQCRLLIGDLGGAKTAYATMLSKTDKSDVEETANSVTKVLANLERALRQQGETVADAIRDAIEAIRHDAQLKLQRLS